MSDINLLPDDLRAKEQKARQQAAGDQSAPQFYNPREKATRPTEGSPPGRWQQLMSALKKNVSSAPLSQSPAPTKPSAPLAPANIEPPTVEVGPPISAPSPTSPPSLAPVQPSSPKPQPLPSAAPKTKIMPPLRGRAQSGLMGGGSMPPLSALDVNLIPAQEGVQVTPQSLATMGAVVTGALLVVFLGYFSLRAYVANKTAESDAIQQDIIMLQQDLESARAGAEQAIATSRRLGFLSDIFKKQTNWENFFVWLEGRTIPTVQFQNLAADASGSITLAGTAPSFTEVGRQMLAFQQSEKVQEIILSGVSIDRDTNRPNSPTTVKFTFAIKLPPSLFLAASQ